MTYEEFKNKVKIFLQKDIVEGETIVAKNLNNYLSTFYKGVEKLVVKSENGIITYYGEDDKQIEGMSQDVFENTWLYYFYVDCVNSGSDN